MSKHTDRSEHTFLDRFVARLHEGIHWSWGALAVLSVVPMAAITMTKSNGVHMAVLFAQTVLIYARRR